MASSASDTTAHKHTNRLAKEKSPYLLQHQHNPVDWYPWGNASSSFESTSPQVLTNPMLNYNALDLVGDEAFKKAREKNKVLMLMIRREEIL
jgi:hypothetical protein